jgi:hypothetical protein
MNFKGARVVRGYGTVNGSAPHMFLSLITPSLSQPILGSSDDACSKLSREKFALRRQCKCWKRDQKHFESLLPSLNVDLIVIRRLSLPYKAGIVGCQMRFSFTLSRAPRPLRGSIIRARHVSHEAEMSAVRMRMRKS